MVLIAHQSCAHRQGTTVATTKLMTAAALYELPETGRFELIQGELVESEWLGFERSTVGVEIGYHLGKHVKDRGLGMITGANGGYLLATAPDTVLTPDIAFVRAERLPPRDERVGFLELAPDLAVLVLSPSDTIVPIVVRVHTYLVLGVALLWLVDPVERSVRVFTTDDLPRTLGIDDTLDGGDVLPGFTVKVAALFP